MSMATSQGLENNIVHRPMGIDINVDQSFSEYVLGNLLEHSQNIAQIDIQTGKTETFGDLLKRSISLAQALKNKGITTEDIIAICCRNNIDYIVVMTASIFIGARFCVLDSSAAKPDIIHCLKITAPVILFCQYESEELLESSINEAGMNCDIVCFDKTDKFVSMKNFVEIFKSDDEFKIDSSRKLKNTCCVTFTSGTSGMAKGAELTNYSFVYNAMIQKRAKIGVKRNMMFTLPYWVSNIASCIKSLILGFTRIINNQFDFETIVKVIQDYEVKSTLFTQHVISGLIRNPEFCNYDTSCLKLVYFGGSKISYNFIKEIRILFPHTNFLNVFGMTELSGLVFIAGKKQLIDEKDNISVGTPIPGYYYKIVNVDTDKSVGPCINGELRIKFIGVMNGYLNHPDLTAEAFDDDGYFKTGDIAYYDENYNFYIVDRLKEIFKYKGYHIAPVVIENALLLNPDVRDCGVIPVPHEHDGELPMAVIQLIENSEATENDFILHIAEHLSDPYQLRGGVKFVNSIPRTSTGKLRRKFLEDLILNQN